MGYLRRRVTSREIKRVKVTIQNNWGVGGSVGVLYKGTWYNGQDTPGEFYCYPGESLTICGGTSGWSGVTLIDVYDRNGTLVYHSGTEGEESSKTVLHTRVVGPKLDHITVTISGDSIWSYWHYNEVWREYVRS